MRIAPLAMMALVVTALATGPAIGAGLPQAKVEYSADSYMESQGMTVASKVYHGENKDRIEMKAQGMNNIMINRLDKKLSWVLMPDQKMYMETSLAEGKKKSKDINDCQLEQQQLGTEAVNGLKTTKNKIALSCPDGLKYNGTMWVTREGIMVKLDSLAKTDKGDVPFKMELKNLNIARQNPGLFEIPEGYQVFNAGGMMGAIGDIMNKATQEREKRAREEAAQRPAEEGRAYTTEPREVGRSFTAEPRAEDGRSYTAQKRSGLGGLGIDPVKVIKGLFSW